METPGAIAPVMPRQQDAPCGALAAGCTLGCLGSKMHSGVFKKRNALWGAWAAGCTLWCSESRMHSEVFRKQNALCGA
eukprot:1156892-Pelagomonas_calceolata.AAC.8